MFEDYDDYRMSQEDGDDGEYSGNGCLQIIFNWCHDSDSAVVYF